jgi:heptosyltransferase I
MEAESSPGAAGQVVATAMRKETVSIPGPRILVIRLGAMGDIIHALPAVATLKHSFPRSHITWVCDAKWTPLLEGNPFVDEVLALERRTMRGLAETWRRLRKDRFDMAVDFQGLMKSALLALVAKADRVGGFDYSAVRERLAALAYSTRVKPTREHVVERCLELAGGCGARNILSTFPLPAGAPEGVLPAGGYVLATPLAGWPAKQWPLEFYSALGARLREAFGIPWCSTRRRRLGKSWAACRMSASTAPGWRG